MKMRLTLLVLQRAKRPRYQKVIQWNNAWHRGRELKVVNRAFREDLTNMGLQLNKPEVNEE